MNLKSITSLTDDEQVKYANIYNEMKEKFGPVKEWRSKLIKDVKHSQTPGTHTYRGQLNDGVSISELELAMVLDNGYSNFGGSSRINQDGTFMVQIYFD